MREERRSPSSSEAAATSDVSDGGAESRSSCRSDVALAADVEESLASARAGESVEAARLQLRGRCEWGRWQGSTARCRAAVRHLTCCSGQIRVLETEEQRVGRQRRSQRAAAVDMAEQSGWVLEVCCPLCAANAVVLRYLRIRHSSALTQDMRRTAGMACGRVVVCGAPHASCCCPALAFHQSTRLHPLLLLQLSIPDDSSSYRTLPTSPCRITAPMATRVMSNSASPST
jgi:hypothetical protein